MRNLPLDRAEAELLNDLLLECAKKKDHTFHIIGNIAANLCETWGMSYWHHIEGSGVDEELWNQLVAGSEFGHRKKSVMR